MDENIGFELFTIFPLFLFNFSEKHSGFLGVNEIKFLCLFKNALMFNDSFDNMIKSC